MSASTEAILDDLEARNLVHVTTDREALRARLASGQMVVYCGMDPTADSLHAGNLVGLLALRRFQTLGHKPISLAGGATGMIGDPGGRSEERNLLSDQVLAENLSKIVPQLQQFLDFDPGPCQAQLRDNRSWTVAMSAVDFLRDVGKHVTVNQMLGKESVKGRLASENGISYTEFSYMLLQANDFVELHRLDNCELQIGGSDQWGNISLGVDLIRRRRGGAVAHGLTWPLLTRADGSKYGKTASGDQIWLGAHRMSPYRFYQAWINIADEEVRQLLLKLTMLSVEECHAIADLHDAAPERRDGQRRLALEVTALVHGSTEANRAVAASDILFGSDPAGVDEATLELIAGEVPTIEVPRSLLAGQGADLVELMVATGLASSKGDGKRTVDQMGLSVNNRKVGPGDLVSLSDCLFGRYVLLRKGRSNYAIALVT